MEMWSVALVDEKTSLFSSPIARSGLQRIRNLSTRGTPLISSSMAGLPSATNAAAEPTQFVSVAIIGGGVAGLAAAGALTSFSSSSLSSKDQRTVLLLEARDELGGRVRQLRGLAPWPLEMGPEFVHGERSPVVVRRLFPLFFLIWKNGPIFFFILSHANPFSNAHSQKQKQQILRDAGCSLLEYEWPDRWFFGDERVLRKAEEAGEEENNKATSTSPPSSSSSSSSRDRDVSLVQGLFASVAEEEEEEEEKAPKTDVSAREWMYRKGLTSKRQQDIAEACFANDFGASLDSLGLRELVTENKEWDVGEAYYVPDAPLSELIKALEAQVPRGCVRRSWPVSSVEVLRGAVEVRRELSSCVIVTSSSLATSPPPRQLVKLTGPNGNVVLARRVVVALPLAVLKASLLSPGGLSSSSALSVSSSSPSSSSSPPPPPPSSLIQFSPPLSDRKLAAMERLLVGNAIKVILSFAEPFWPDDFFDAVCPGCFVPEFWVKKPPARRHFEGKERDNEDHSLSPHVVTGFLCGRFAQEAQALGERETVRKALEQLDEMFRNEHNKGSASPASDAFLASRVIDWSLDPWALGAYSHPSLGARRGDRRALASPECWETLFFAGEATHEAVNPCLQAAIETGERAAREVLLDEKRAADEATGRSKL